MKKYKLTETKLEYDEHTLYQIEALTDFSTVSGKRVKKGDLGGYIEKESNLLHEGFAWIAEQAKVYGDACVGVNALVSGEAKVYDDAAVFGCAQVCENAEVFDHAQVYDYSKISGNARISGNVRIFDFAKVSGDAQVCDDVLVYGEARVSDYTILKGNEIVLL